MARKRRKSDASFEEKMDMTPLIDAVFLLIMFFILTTEITVDIEEVTLPFATEGNTDKTSESETVVMLNVVLEKEQTKRGDAAIVFQGKKVDQKQLVVELQKEVDWDMNPEGRGRAPEKAAGNLLLSQLKIRVRADKQANAAYLRTIFTACQEVNPKIYKLEVSSEQPSSN